MTENTVTSAVEKRQAGAMAVTSQSRNWLAGLLPSHVEVQTFVNLANANLRRTIGRKDGLADAANADPAGYMLALAECARLGLVPGDTFHIVNFKRFKDRRFVGWDFVGITDYTGEIELMYRAGAIAAVKAEIVYEQDRFHFTPDMDRPAHEIDWFNPKGRGQMIGVYAYAVMKDGAHSRVVVMSRPEVEKIKAVSKTAFDRDGKPRSDSPWTQWEDRMWLKTAIHQLEKWVPTSAEWRREQLRAAVEADNLRAPAASTAESGAPASSGAEFVDAEIVGEEPDTPEEQDPRDVGADPLTGQAEG